MAPSSANPARARYQSCLEARLKGPEGPRVCMLSGTTPLRAAHRVPAVRWQWRAICATGPGTQARDPARRAEGGTALPATRALATELGLSRNTVITAYEMLCAEQLAVQGRARHLRVGRRDVGGQAPTKSQLPAQTRYAARLRRLPAPTLRRVAPRLRYDLHYGEPLVNPALVTAWRRTSHAQRRSLRVGLPAKRRPECPAPGHQRIPCAAPWRGVPCRRRGHRQRHATGGLAAGPRADRRGGGRRDRGSRLRTRVTRVAGAWRATAAGQGGRRGPTGRGAAARETVSAWSTSRRRTSSRRVP